MAVSVLATVATTSPLTVTFDGDATTHVPAKRITGYTATVGDRVRVELRTPIQPLIVGKVGT